LALPGSGMTLTWNWSRWGLGGMILTKRTQEISIGAVTINPQIESYLPTRKITLIPNFGK